MRSAIWSPVVVVLMACTLVHAQEVSLEYRLKAAYLLNFTKFVEWPAAAAAGRFRMCVAGRNPFGDVLAATLRGETVGTRPIDVSVTETPQRDCDAVFVPKDVALTPFLRMARGTPTLTVGETPGFSAQGGIINFVMQEGTVRFQINPREAERAGLRVSSHLLRLAQSPDR